MNEYRKEIDVENMPESIKRLPVHRGYPVPFFVAKINGVFDLRIADQKKMIDCIEQKLCWTCGEKLGKVFAFPIGSMCVVNRTIAEPPNHVECAQWSIKNCPFLNQRQYKRNESNLPDGVTMGAGCPIRRQPNVTCLWITDKYKLFDDGSGGILFRIGEPILVEWFSRGRRATESEIKDSIKTGLPNLEKMARLDGFSAMAQLRIQIQAAEKRFVYGYDERALTTSECI